MNLRPQFNVETDWTLSAASNQSSETPTAAQPQGSYGGSLYWETTVLAAAGPLQRRSDVFFQLFQPVKRLSQAVDDLSQLVNEGRSLSPSTDRL